MEHMNISEVKIMEFAKKGFVDLGYPENIEIHSSVADGNPHYYATYTIEEYGEKHIKPLRTKDIIQLVKYSMEMEGYDSPELNIRVRDGQVCYSVMANIVTYGNGKGRNKRRG
jgi:hypothetical protein